METKQCSKCKEIKEVCNFYRIRGDSGYRSSCKDCINASLRLKYNEDDEYKKSKNEKVRRKWHEDSVLWSARQLTVRKHHLKKHYKMSLDEYAARFKEQNECCAICGIHYTLAVHKQLMVDHCHQTGNVRELLCDLCNTALGKFKDSPELLIKAADYIRKHNGNIMGDASLAACSLERSSTL